VALTATSCGNLVVWLRTPDKTNNNNNIKATSNDKMKASKIIRIQEKPITVLTSIDDWIVTSDVNGYVKFFDFELKLIYW